MRELIPIPKFKSFSPMLFCYNQMSIESWLLGVFVWLCIISYLLIIKSSCYISWDICSLEITSNCDCHLRNLVRKEDIFLAESKYDSHKITISPALPFFLHAPFSNCNLTQLNYTMSPFIILSSQYCYRYSYSHQQ